MVEKSEKSPKEYRVIFRLANGKKKYATHQGQILLWDEDDIRALKLNLIRYEKFAYTEDLEHFAFFAEDLAVRYPRTPIVRVTGFRKEEATDPLDPNVIV